MFLGNGQLLTAETGVAWKLEGIRIGSRATPQVEKSMGDQKSQVDTQGAPLGQMEAQTHFVFLVAPFLPGGVGVRHSGQSPSASAFFLVPGAPAPPGFPLPSPAAPSLSPCRFLSSSLCHVEMSLIWSLLYSLHPLCLHYLVPTHGFEPHLCAETSTFLSRT